MQQPQPSLSQAARLAMIAAACAGGFALGMAAPQGMRAAADAAPLSLALPAPPANGAMGFVVDGLAPPAIHDKDACPNGRAPRLRDAYLATLPQPEADRLRQKENEPELTRRWQAYVTGPGGTNVCSQPDMFDRPLIPAVGGRYAVGFDLDGGNADDTCAHDEFQSPNGEMGIDNQEYRAMGCSGAERAEEGNGSEVQRGYRQFMASGEWTQVLLLRGVDSLQNDDEVEVIYANTPDRPQADSKGNFLRGVSYTISTEPPRMRNALKGKIRNGVLTTEPADIKLTQTWGQSSIRDTRGRRSKFDYRKGRLRLAFQSDGSLRGLLGGYRPVFDVIAAPAIGGLGSAIVAGIDCAQQLKMLRHYADGLKDPKTGKCTAVSSAIAISAVPAFVNDSPPLRSLARSSE
jgi:hypothetical protein